MITVWVSFNICHFVTNLFVLNNKWLQNNISVLLLFGGSARIFDGKYGYLNVNFSMLSNVMSIILFNFLFNSFKFQENKSLDMQYCIVILCFVPSLIGDTFAELLGVLFSFVAP